MNSPGKDLELLEYLDGTASPATRERIEAEMNRDAALRARRDELASVFQRLSRIEPAAAPSDLRDRVIQKIRTQQSLAARSTARTTGLGAWFAAISPRSRLVAGMSFAAGLALGVIAMGPGRHGFTPAIEPSNGIVGTMGGADSVAPDARLQLTDARMTASARREGDRWIVTVVLALPEGASAELSDPGATREPLALRRLTGRTGACRLEADRAAWTGPVNGRYEIEFEQHENEAAPFHLTLDSPAGSASTPLIPGAQPTP